MKQLLAMLLLALAACNKPSPSDAVSLDLYYRIVEISVDGKRTESPIKHTSRNVSRDGNGNNNPGGGNGNGNGGGNNNGGGGCVPIKVETIQVQKIDELTYRITWEAENEQSTKEYLVERSLDSKGWAVRKSVRPGTGSYEVIDNL